MVLRAYKITSASLVRTPHSVNKHPKSRPFTRHEIITSVMKYLMTGRHAFHDGHIPFHDGRDEIKIGSTKSYSGS